MRIAAVVALASILALAGCAHRKDGAACPAGMCPTAAVAVLQPTKGNAVGGVIRFAQQGADTLKITGDITGLAPNSKHAFHIHEFGDASSADGASAGGHYNPAKHDHGAPDPAHHHAGDLGNVQADAQGAAHVELVLKGLSIACGATPVLGRAVVLHEKEDDLTSQPAGNAGARIAVGVIGVAKSP